MLKNIGHSSSQILSSLVFWLCESGFNEAGGFCALCCKRSISVTFPFTSYLSVTSWMQFLQRFPVFLTEWFKMGLVMWYPFLLSNFMESPLNMSLQIKCAMQKCFAFAIVNQAKATWKVHHFSVAGYKELWRNPSQSGRDSHVLTVASAFCFIYRVF